jgi:ribosomal protein S18 acetylase RimI-like enzyme
VEAVKDGYTDLPAGKLASVVTYLEMRTPPARRAGTTTSEFAIRRVEKADLDWYRRLYREIGASWLWSARLRMTDDQLRALLHNPEIDIFVLSHNGVDGGLLEFDRREMPDIEILYFGVAPSLFGSGAGRMLLEHCLRLGWEHGPDRVWLHTCTLDHPRALGFYRKAGFVPYKRAIEILDDPRVTGDLPRDAAPQVPIL